MMQSRATTRHAGGILRWLNESRHAASIWFNKWSVLAAWVGLFLATITPPHGLGVSLCWFQSATGLPCPGCGMTRSLSCAVRGMFLESVEYHPFGLFVLALFIVTAAQSLSPERIRAGLRRYIEAHARAFNTFYLVFVAAFVSFGVVRAIAHLVTGCIDCH